MTRPYRARYGGPRARAFLGRFRPRTVGTIRECQRSGAAGAGVGPWYTVMGRLRDAGVDPLRVDLRVRILGAAVKGWPTRYFLRTPCIPSTTHPLTIRRPEREHSRGCASVDIGTLRALSPGMTRDIASAAPIASYTVRPHTMRRGEFVLVLMHTDGAESALYPGRKSKAFVAEMGARMIGESCI